MLSAAQKKHAIPTIRVHPELDGRTLNIVHSLKKINVFTGKW